MTAPKSAGEATTTPQCQISEEEIKLIAMCVRERVTRAWHHPDWNYMYYADFEKAVSDGIKLALAKQQAKDRAATGLG